MRTRGYIDGVFGEAVRGWVVDLDDPGAPLNVTVRFDGVIHPSVAADEPRPDLDRAGIGQGVGGFRVHLGLEPDAGPHEVLAVIDGTTVTVPLATDFRVLDGGGEARDGVDLFTPVTAERVTAPVLPPVAEDETVPIDAPAVPAPAPVPEAGATDGLLLGESGWAYACPASGFDLLRGARRPDSGVLDGLFETVAELDGAAREIGATVLVAVVPDKLFVYPEHAPMQMPVLAAGRLAEALAARVQDDDRIALVDLLPSLLRARRHGRLFGRGTADLTALGAFHAYRAVAKAGPPRLRPCAVADAQSGPERPARGPAGRPVYRWGAEGLRTDPAATVPAGAAASELVGFQAPGDPIRLVVTGDEATRPVGELLAAHGGGTPVHAGRRPDFAALERQRPEAVVWLVSDGTLVELALEVGAMPS